MQYIILILYVNDAFYNAHLSADLPILSRDDLGTELLAPYARMLCNTVGQQENAWLRIYCKDNYPHIKRWTNLTLVTSPDLTKVVREMLRNENPDVNAEDGYHGNVLQAASAKGHVQIVQMLLDKGANVSALVGK